MSVTKIGTATSTIQAPWVNFTMVTTTSTTPVVTAPRVLITIERRHPGSRCFSQCLIIPDWLIVNDVNTPTTYNWMSRVTSAWKA